MVRSYVKLEKKKSAIGFDDLLCLDERVIRKFTQFAL